MLPSTIPISVSSINFGESALIFSYKSTQFISSGISIISLIQTSPQSSPSSVIIVQIPVCLSPLIIALCIGLAPLYFGNNDA